LGCDRLLGIGDEEGGNNEVPDVAFGTYYVAASGNDANGGTSEFPLQTVEEALGRLATDYAQENWPDKGEPNEEAGEIIIRGTVTASSAILINGTGYPSIVLRGESGSGSKLVWSGALATDYLLKITSGAKMTLDEDLTLTRTTPNGAMVYVGTGSAFTMNSGDIAGNSLEGRGVYVGENGAFTMNGGTISGNSITGYGNGYGGGVDVSKGEFTMNGGTISGNSINVTGAGYGGGVDVDRGAFTMNGGTIADNTINVTGFGYGGGVCVSKGGFTMNGGTIAGNKASYGGGVINSNSAFTMNEGTISGNEAAGYGGGVVNMSYSGKFTMNEGTISGNKAGYGGGVANVLIGGKFTMNGGTISGNEAGSGGGVYVYSGGEFQKNSGGIIYGASEGANTNTASSQGHAVFVESDPIKERDSTAGVDVLLNSGADGGWENE
jgi:hypothetical protein